MIADLKWRREYFLPVPSPLDPMLCDDRLVLSVEGSYDDVFAKDPEMKDAPIRKLTLLNPPTILPGDLVRYVGDAHERFVGKVTRIGQPFPSRVFNVDLRHPDSGNDITVPCEDCEVVFRPRFRVWTEDEVRALLKSSSTLTGRERSKSAKILEGENGYWVVTFWLSEERIDSKTYCERDHNFRFRDIVRVANAWLFQEPVKIGDYWTENINQGDRFVEVVAVKKLRYRIEYEMPNAGRMGSWQRGLLIGGRLYA